MSIAPRRSRRRSTSPSRTIITSAAWGSIWSRPQLTLRERSLITIAILGALGQTEEIELHVRATKNTGASADDIREVLLHIAGYAGVPAARSAVAAAKRALAEMEGRMPPRRGSHDLRTARLGGKPGLYRRGLQIDGAARPEAET